MSSERK